MINQFGGKLIKFAELLVPLKFVLGPKQGTVHLLCFNPKKNSNKNDTRQHKTGTSMQVMSTSNAHTWNLLIQPIGMLQQRTIAWVIHIIKNSEASEMRSFEQKMTE